MVSLARTPQRFVFPAKAALLVQAALLAAALAACTASEPGPQPEDAAMDPPAPASPMLAGDPSAQEGEGGRIKQVFCHH